MAAAAAVLPRVTVTVTGSVGQGVLVAAAVGVTVTVTVGVTAHWDAEDEEVASAALVDVSAVDVDLAADEVETGDEVDAMLVDVVATAASDVLVWTADEELDAAPPDEPETIQISQQGNHTE